MNALVIGGSGTLGTAIVRDLLECGAGVTATYLNNSEPLDQLARESKNLQVLKCDARSRGFISDVAAQTIKRHGSVDALVFAAGVGADRIFIPSGERFNFSKLEEINEDDVDEMVSLHIKGALWACQAVVPHMKERRNGRIVIMNSLDGVKMMPSPAHFAMSKAALKGLVESVAKECGSFGITINQINMGLVDGPAVRLVSQKLQKEYLKHCSLERFAKPEEASALASWLCLNNTYITGQSIVLDGGL